MKQRMITTCALLAALWCAGCGSVFNGAIDDMTLRQTSWYTFLGGAEDDVASSVQQTSDGGYIVAGYASTDITFTQGIKIVAHSSGSNYDLLVVKLDSSGNVAWYTFLGSASGFDNANSIQQTSDGGYIVSGQSNATIASALMQNAPCRNNYAGGSDMLVVKLDSSGNVSWYTFLGGSDDDAAYSIQQTSDSGYIVAGIASTDITVTQGTRINPHSGSGNDMLVVKLDSSGNVSWYTFLGDTGDDRAQAIQQTSNGGYIIGGQSNATITSARMQNAPCRNSYTGTSTDMLVVKLDSSGNVAWYTFLGGTGSDVIYSLQHTLDGGYIVAGRASAMIETERMQNAPCRNAYSGASPDMLAVRLDSSGNVAWYTFLGGSGIDTAWSVLQTDDGGYIVAGFTSTDLTLPQGTKLGAFSGGHDMLVVKLDSGGMVSWYTLLGGTGQDTARSIEQTSDGGYIVAGNTNVAISTLQGKEPLNKFAGGIEYDMLIVKLRNDGTL